MSEESANPTFRIDPEKITKYRELTGTEITDIVSEATGQIEEAKVTIRTMKDIFLMSASIGVRNEKYTNLPSGSPSPFRWHNLNAHEDRPIAKALALKATNDINVLSSLVKIRDILEAYANWGFDILYREISKPGERHLNLAKLLLETIND